MKVPELTESKEKLDFRYLFFEPWSFFVVKSTQFSINCHDNSKNINIKNQKIDFSFV